MWITDLNVKNKKQDYIFMTLGLTTIKEKKLINWTSSE